MSGSPEAVHEVLVEALADPSPAGQERFHAAMLATFGVAKERSQALIANLPRAVLRTANLEEARLANDALLSAGAISRINSPTLPPPAAAPTPAPSGVPTPAPSGVPTPAPSRVPTPAPPGVPPPPGAAGSVLCRECGALQAATNKLCARCSFPLGTRETPRPAPAAAATAASIPPRPMRAPAEEDTTPSLPVRAMAAAITWLGAVSALVQLVVLPEAAGPQVAGIVVPALLGWWIFKGSKGARVFVTVISVLACVAVLGIRFLLNTAAAQLGIEGMDAVSTVLLVSIPAMALYVALLWGRGSMAKAWLLGAPCLLIQVWSTHAITLGEAGRTIAQFTALEELADVQPLLAQGRLDEAIDRLEAIADKARDEENEILLGNALLILGSTQLSAGRIEPAIESLEEAAEVRPDDQNVATMLARAHEARDRTEQQRGYTPIEEEAVPPWPDDHEAPWPEEEPE